MVFYLSDLLLSYQPSQILRYSGTGLVINPKCTTKTHGEAAASYYGPHIGKSLLKSISTDAKIVDIVLNFIEFIYITFVPSCLVFNN